MIKVRKIISSDNQIKFDSPDVVFVNEIVHSEESLDKSIKKIIDCIERDDMEMARNATKSAIYKGQKLEQTLRSFPKIFGLPKAKAEIRRDLIEDGNVSFSIEDGNILKIVLPELFPLRFRGGTKTEQYDNIRSRYVSSFDAYFAHNPFKRYKERVVVVYKSVYRSKNDIMDYDNFDLKQLTDCISTYCLIDDNPSRIVAVSDYEIGDKEHSEVILIPVSKFKDYSDDIFRQKD